MQIVEAKTITSICSHGFDYIVQGQKDVSVQTET